MKKPSSQSGFTPTLKLALSKFCAKIFSLHKNIDTLSLPSTGEMYPTKRREFGSRGFSLVETLVAITILLIVITGPLAISSSAAKSSSFSSEQVTAFFLAQEGVELVEKARDDLLVQYFIDSNSATSTFTSANPDPWSDFTRTTSGPGGGIYRNCYVSVNASGCDLTIGTDQTGTIATPVNCGSSPSACVLNVDKSSGNVRSRYTHSSSANTIPTPFTRTITLEPVNADEVRVISKVTWRTGALKAQQEVFVESRLFNIYGY